MMQRFPAFMLVALVSAGFGFMASCTSRGTNEKGAAVAAEASPPLAGPGDMQVDLGPVGAIMRHHFEREPKHAAAFDGDELAALATELDEHQLWLVVPVKPRGETYAYREDLNPHVVIWPGRFDDAMRTMALEPEAELPWVREGDEETPDQLYVAVTIEWSAQPGKGVRIDLDDVPLPVRQFVRGEGFTFGTTILQLSARAPGIYPRDHIE